MRLGLTSSWAEPHAIHVLCAEAVPYVKVHVASLASGDKDSQWIIPDMAISSDRNGHHHRLANAVKGCGGC